MWLVLFLMLSASPATRVPQANGFDAVRALHVGQYKQLEAHFAAVQSRFERGQISDDALVDAYKVFYPVDTKPDAAFDAWIAHDPRSYHAHLALGIHDHKVADLLRGTGYISTTPASQLAAMEQPQMLATRELTLSLKLNPRPYLAILYLLNIATSQGDDQAADRWLAMGNRLFPQNLRIRMRYLIHLEPRWGGSYPAMEAFIERSAREGVRRNVVSGLKAIEHQDIGCTAWEGKQYPKARAEFMQAVAFGQQAGGDFTARNLDCAQKFLAERPPEND